MAPIVEAFPPWQLQKRVNIGPDGKLLRKDKSEVDLEKCKLKELVQFECDLQGPARNPRSVVVCAPLVRLFRQCGNGLMVETTAWEGVFDTKAEKEG